MKKIGILFLFLGHSVSYPLFQGFKTFRYSSSRPFNSSFSFENKHNNIYRTVTALGLFGGIVGGGIFVKNRISKDTNLNPLKTEQSIETIYSYETKEHQDYWDLMERVKQEK